MGENQRCASPRVKTFLRGLIYYNNRSSAADCLIRDLSETGAKLELPGNVVIPYLISLYIPKKKETLGATVQWRHNDMLGIAFTGPAVNGGDPGYSDAAKVAEQESQIAASLAERVQRMKADVASLKRTIKGLLELKANSLRMPA
jgi:hypothetical protein